MTLYLISTRKKDIHSKTDRFERVHRSDVAFSYDEYQETQAELAALLSPLLILQSYFDRRLVFYFFKALLSKYFKALLIHLRFRTEVRSTRR